jgi:hypothetical protein
MGAKSRWRERRGSRGLLAAEIPAIQRPKIPLLTPNVTSHTFIQVKGGFRRSSERGDTDTGNEQASSQST